MTEENQEGRRARETRRRMSIYLGMSERLGRAPTTHEFAKQARITNGQADYFLWYRGLPKTPAAYEDGRAEAVPAVRDKKPEPRAQQSFRVRMEPPEVTIHPAFIPRRLCIETPGPKSRGIWASCAACGTDVGFVWPQMYPLFVNKDGLRALLCRNCYERGGVIIRE